MLQDSQASLETRLVPRCSCRSARQARRSATRIWAVNRQRTPFPLIPTSLMFTESIFRLVHETLLTPEAPHRPKGGTHVFALCSTISIHICVPAWINTNLALKAPLPKIKLTWSLVSLDATISSKVPGQCFGLKCCPVTPLGLGASQRWFNGHLQSLAGRKERFCRSHPQIVPVSLYHAPEMFANMIF